MPFARNGFLPHTNTTCRTPFFDRAHLNFCRIKTNIVRRSKIQDQVGTTNWFCGHSNQWPNWNWKMNMNSRSISPQNSRIQFKWASCRFRLLRVGLRYLTYKPIFLRGWCFCSPIRVLGLDDKKNKAENKSIHCKWGTWIERKEGQ